MTLISFDQFVKDKEGTLLTKDVEAAVMTVEQEEVDHAEVSVPLYTANERIKTLVGGIFFVLVTFQIFFLIAYFVFPPCYVNPNPHRVVHLNKTGGGYGFELDGERIAGVIPGGPAEGRLLKDDTILSINGVNVEGLRAGRISALIDTRDRDVVLVVVAKAPEPPYRPRIERAMRNAAFVSFALLIIIILAVMGEKRSGAARVVVLQKAEGGYGFANNGRMVTEVTPGGPADCHLKRGNEIIAINGVRVMMLGTDTINELLQTRDDDVKLAIRGSA